MIGHDAVNNMSAALEIHVQTKRHKPRATQTVSVTKRLHTPPAPGQAGTRTAAGSWTSRGAQ